MRCTVLLFNGASHLSWINCRLAFFHRFLRRLVHLSLCWERRTQEECWLLWKSQLRERCTRRQRNLWKKASRQLIQKRWEALMKRRTVQCMHFQFSMWPPNSLFDRLSDGWRYCSISFTNALKVTCQKIGRQDKGKGCAVCNCGSAKATKNNCSLYLLRDYT